jgi:O-antigen/teichoic acid export membrane protein
MSLEKELFSKISLLFLMNGLGKAFVLFTNIFLARNLSVESYGEFIYVLSVITVMTFITKFGLDQTVLKFVPMYEVNGEKNKIRSFNSFIVIFTSIISILLIIIIVMNPDFFAIYILGNINYREVLSYQLYLLLFLTLLNILASMFQSRKDIMTYSISINLFQNGLFLLFIFLVSIFNFINLQLVIYLKYASLIISLIYLFIKIKNKNWMGSIKNIHKEEYIKIINFSIPMMFVGVIGIIIIQTSVYMTGYFHNPSSVAILNSASQVAIVVSFMLQAINQVFAPYISKMYYEGNLKQLNNLYSKINYFMSVFSLVFLVLLVIFKHQVMSIFGPEFLIGANAMIIIAIGQVYNALTGPCEYILTMSGHHIANLIINIITLVVAVVSGIILIPSYGFIGGALCTSISLIISNTIRVWIMYKKVGIVPFKLLKMN